MIEKSFTANSCSQPLSAVEAVNPFSARSRDGSRLPGGLKAFMFTVERHFHLCSEFRQFLLILLSFCRILRLPMNCAQGLQAKSTYKYLQTCYCRWEVRFSETIMCFLNSCINMFSSKLGLNPNLERDIDVVSFLVGSWRALFLSWVGNIR